MTSAYLLSECRNSLGESPVESCRDGLLHLMMTDHKGEQMMDINSDKLGDIFELIKAYKSHRITLINDHKANDVDIECLIKGILDKNINYTCCSDGTILEITRI